MHAVAQHHFTHLPSLRGALSALLLTAIVVALGLSVVGDRVTLSQHEAQAVSSTDLQPDSSRMPANANRSLAADETTKNVRLWPSDIMDSHESVPSLAALSKTPGSNAKPL